MTFNKSNKLFVQYFPLICNHALNCTNNCSHKQKHSERKNCLEDCDEYDDQECIPYIEKKYINKLKTLPLGSGWGDTIKRRIYKMNLKIKDIALIVNMSVALLSEKLVGHYKISEIEKKLIDDTVKLYEKGFLKKE